MRQTAGTANLLENLGGKLEVTVFFCNARKESYNVFEMGTCSISRLMSIYKGITVEMVCTFVGDHSEDTGLQRRRNDLCSKAPHPEDVRSTKILSVPLWILPNDQRTADDDSALTDEMRPRWLMLTTASPITSGRLGQFARFRLLCWDSVWLRSALLGGELL